MDATATGVKIVGPTDGKEGFIGTIGVRFLIDAGEAGERFSLVEHPMSSRALAAPLQELIDLGGASEADPEAFAQLRERYGLQLRPETVPELLERFGLRMGEPLSGGWSP
jgi:hypothetical protein